MKIQGIEVTKKKDLEALKTTQLVDLYNRYTKKDTKKFSTRAKGIEQVWSVIKDKIEETPVKKSTIVSPTRKFPLGSGKSKPSEPKAVAPKRSTKKGYRFSFNFVPEPGAPKPHRPNSKGRAVAIATLLKDGGGTFEEVMAATGWNEKKAYEGIRLLHYKLNWGMKLDDETGKIKLYAGK